MNRPTTRPAMRKKRSNISASLISPRSSSLLVYASNSGTSIHPPGEEGGTPLRAKIKGTTTLKSAIGTAERHRLNPKATSAQLLKAAVYLNKNVNRAK
ncbi:hypothetical protein [Planobispora rosea]|uniref:hypothetical protein n=1 Tax=Planobispora rosea TaxID=35762 RepID=UPI00114C94C7|nr:hypothetical protein [Planobispora rosea]